MDNLGEASESPQLYFEQAIADGDVETVRKLVTRSSHGLTSGDGRVNATALFLLSVQGGNIDIIESVLQLRPPPNVQFIDDKDRLLLHFAAETGSLSVVETLLSLDDSVVNAHVNMSDVDGRTPIMIAASKGYADIVEFFIQKGGRPNEGRLIATGDSILHLASRGGHLSVVEVLIKHGADVNCRTPSQYMEKGGMTVLHSAVQGRNTEVVKLLCANGADQSITNAFMQCAFHMAAHKGHIDIVRTFIDIGADLEMRDGTRRTPLVQAVLGQAEEVVAYLLKCGADVSAVNEEGFQSLHHAAAADRVDIVQMLIKHGADVDPESFWSQTTPLMQACVAGNPSVVEHLIAHGVDVNKVDENGQTALHKVHLYEIDMEIKEDLSLQLIAAGANINVQDNHGFTPFRILLFDFLHAREPLNVVKIFVRHGAELPDLSQPSFAHFWRQYRVSPLRFVVARRFYDIARFLVLAGWDLRQENWLDLRQENWLDLRHENWVYLLQENWLNLRDKPPEYNNFMAFLRSQITEPKSLTWLCRHSIRRTLIQVSDGKEILSKVAQLPVPNAVKSILKLDDI